MRPGGASQGGETVNSGVYVHMYINICQRDNYTYMYNIYMYVCMCMYIYIYMYTHISIDMYIHIWIYILLVSTVGIYLDMLNTI